MTQIKRLGLKVVRHTVAPTPSWTINGVNYTGNKGEAVLKYLLENGYRFIGTDKNGARWTKQEA